MTEDALGPPPPEPVRKVRGDALRRAEKVWRARVAGASWAQAAEMAGFSDPANAVRAVRRVFDDLPEPEREEQRRLWRARLERVWTQALADVLGARPGAVTAAVRVADRAARLDGLDSPTVLEMSNPTQDEIEALVNEVLALTQPQIEEGNIFEAEIVEDTSEEGDDP